MTKATFGIDNEVNHQLCVQQLKSANHHRLLLTAFYKTNRLLVHGDLNSKDFQILKSPILHTIFPKIFQSFSSHCPFSFLAKPVTMWYYYGSKPKAISKLVLHKLSVVNL